MKTGFEIRIQSNLNDKERESAIFAANEFITKTLADPKKRYLGLNSKGGWRSYFKRGYLGWRVGENLTLRRISKNKRVFGVVKESELTLIDRDSICGCICPDCRNTKVEWVSKEPEMFSYCIIGDVKG